MTVYTKCPSCRNEIIFRTSAQDRVRLKMIHGDKIELKCMYCNSTKKYVSSDFKPKRSKINLLVAALVFVIGTSVIFLLLWNYIWQAGLYGVLGLLSMTLIPVSVYGIINKNEQKRVNSFNRS